MLPYILLVILPLLAQHISIKKSRVSFLPDKSNSETAVKLFWFVLFALLVLRHEVVGRDLSNYKYIYEYISKSDWKATLERSNEIGYSILNKLISLVTDHFRGVMIVSAVLAVYFTAKSYVKYSQDAILSIAIYINVSCFVMLFSGLRQSIAMAIGFWAFELVRKKKIVPFLLVVLLAMTFHISAFMLLFMYPLYYIRIRQYHLLFIVPVLLVSLVYNQNIFTFLGNLLSSFTDYDTTIKETGAYTTLILFAIMAAFSFLIPDESKLDADTRGMRNFLLMAVALQMFVPLHTLAMRMNYYYIMFIPIVMSRVLECRSQRWSQVAILARHIMVIFFIVYFFVNAPSDNTLDTFPYRFYWEDINFLS